MTGVYMSLYLNQIAQLIALQKVDNEIYDIDKKLSKVPHEIDSLSEKVDDYTAQKHKIDEKLSHLLEQEKRLFGEFESSLANLKKSQEKLDGVENEKEHSAAMRELDTMEYGAKNREDEQIVLQNEIELQKNNLEEVINQLEETTQQLQDMQDYLEKLSKESELELSKLDVARKESVSHIPVPILSRYEFIRRRLKHPVIVPIKTGVCTGCHIAIPPQIYNELQKGQQIVSCPSCQRLVFWSEHFEKKDEQENNENS